MTRIEFIHMILQKYKHDVSMSDLYSVNSINALLLYIEDSNFTDEELSQLLQEFEEDNIVSFD